LNKDLLN